MADDTRLRVAHIITQMELGGAQRNTLYTVTHLNAERFEPFLMSGPGGQLDEEARHLGMHHEYIPTLVRPIHPWNDAWAFVKLYQRLRYLQPDIVHTHSSKAGILGRLAAYLAGVPVIIHTYHGFGFTPLQHPWVQRFYIFIEKVCAWMTTLLIFVSEDNRLEAAAKGIGLHTENRLIRSGIEWTIAPSVSHWGNEEQRKKPDGSIRQKSNIPPQAWVVAYVGNFKPQKNPLDLAKVAEQVVSKAPDVHFVLVGDGEKRDEVAHYVESHGLKDHVHLPSWRRHDDIPKIFAESNCFLLTSLWEGLPRALVEAFAAELPAVCYAVNGVLDILKDGENGFLIPPGNVPLAAEKVLWLKAHPEEAKKMGRRGRAQIRKETDPDARARRSPKRIKGEFDIDYMVEQQAELYVKLFNQVPLKEYSKSHGSVNPS